MVMIREWIGSRVGAARTAAIHHGVTWSGEKNPAIPQTAPAAENRTSRASTLSKVGFVYWTVLYIRRNGNGHERRTYSNRIDNEYINIHMGTPFLIIRRFRRFRRFLHDVLHVLAAIKIKCLLKFRNADKIEPEISEITPKIELNLTEIPPKIGRNSTKNLLKFHQKLVKIHPKNLSKIVQNSTKNWTKFNQKFPQKLGKNWLKFHQKLVKIQPKFG